MKRFAILRRVAVLACLTLIEASCGNTFRPVVIIVPTPPPDPKGTHAAFLITNNGPFNPGAAMQIDVSGDTNVGVATVGIEPNFALVQPPGGRVIVSNGGNSAVSGTDSVTIFNPSTFTSIGLPLTISLPSGSHPVYIAATSSNEFYVANAGTSTVAAVSSVTNTVSMIIPLDPVFGANPFALAQTPDTKKVYVISTGAAGSLGGITSIATVDNTVTNVISGGGVDNPVAIAIRSDSQRAYVLNKGNGDLTVINTFDDSLIANSISAGAGADFMTYDSNLNRLYIANPVLNTVTVLNAAVDPPAVLTTVPLSSVAGAGNPISVAPLPDGTRFYVLSEQLGNTCPPGVAAPCVATQLTVFNANDYSYRKTIPLPTVTEMPACQSVRFRFSAVASADSSRVYVGNCDAGAASIVRTSDDTFVLNLVAPSGVCTEVGCTVPPPQKPVLVIAGS